MPLSVTKTRNKGLELFSLLLSFLFLIEANVITLRASGKASSTTAGPSYPQGSADTEHQKGDKYSVEGLTVVGKQDGVVGGPPLCSCARSSGGRWTKRMSMLTQQERRRARQLGARDEFQCPERDGC